MRSRTTWWRACASVVVVALFAAACGDDNGDDTADPAEPVQRDDESTIVVGAESLPDVLNMVLFDGATSWTVWTTGPALARGYRVMPDFTYEPWLFDDDCSVEESEAFVVSCRIRDDAVWSDGTAISAEDFEYTYDVMMDPDNDVWSTLGYEYVTEFAVTSPTEFSVTFDAPFPAYRDLWATGAPVFPKHVLDGEDFNTVWNDCICDPETDDPIGSGPYLVESFAPDERLTLVKNDDYWDGEARADRVVFDATPETDTQFNALAADEVDVIYPQESVDLRQRIEAVDGAVLETGIGAAFEHLYLLTTAPGLDDVAVRQAIATALPRQQVVDTVARPVNEDVVVLDNSIYVTNQAEYVPNWSIYPAGGDVEAAAAILDAAGWERDGDGVRSRDDVELSFTIGTTAGDQGRELAQQIIQDRLAELGIELEIDNAADFFDRVDDFEYPIALYGADATPDPLWAGDVYDSEAALNPTLQSNEQVDALLAQANGEADPDARAALVNAADRIMAEEVVSVIPLYQKPAVLAYRDVVSGLILNVTLEGFTWNIEDWERTG